MKQCISIGQDNPGCTRIKLRQGEPKILYFKFTKSGIPIDLTTEYSDIYSDIKRTVNNTAKTVLRKRFSNNGLVISGVDNDVLELHFFINDTEDLSDTELVGDIKFVRNGVPMRLIDLQIKIGQVVTY